MARFLLACFTMVKNWQTTDAIAPTSKTAELSHQFEANRSRMDILMLPAQLKLSNFVNARITAVTLNRKSAFLSGL